MTLVTTFPAGRGLSEWLELAGKVGRPLIRLPQWLGCHSTGRVATGSAFSPYRYSSVAVSSSLSLRMS